MKLLYFVFVQMPWFGFVAIGAFVFYISTLTDDGTNQRIAEIEAAIAAGQPDAVTLNNYIFSGQKINEATIIVQLVPEANIRLVDTTNGVKTDEDYMYVLSDPTDTGDLSRVKGLMILESREHNQVMEGKWLTENWEGVGALGPLIKINGMVSRGDGEASHAKDGLEMRNLEAASGMIYISPFFQGRDVALADLLESAERQTGFLMTVGILIALFGIGKSLIVNRITSILKQQAAEERGL